MFWFVGSQSNIECDDPIFNIGFRVTVIQRTWISLFVLVWRSFSFDIICTRSRTKLFLLLKRYLEYLFNWQATCLSRATELLQSHETALGIFLVEILVESPFYFIRAIMFHFTEQKSGKSGKKNKKKKRGQ